MSDPVKIKISKNTTHFTSFKKLFVNLIILKKYIIMVKETKNNGITLNLKIEAEYIIRRISFSLVSNL